MIYSLALNYALGLEFQRLLDNEERQENVEASFQWLRHEDLYLLILLRKSSFLLLVANANLIIERLDD